MTNEQRMTMRLNTRKNITVWGDPKNILKSQYGLVPYRDWCEKEIVRMRANVRETVLVEMEGMVAVARP